jgi:DNA-binding response OmpR family regulator
LTKNRILFVDDDIELRGIVKDQLISAGFLLDEAGDVKEARERLGKRVYDLVLLDITMPGETGMEVLKFVKDEGLPSRVIVLTGMAGLTIAIESLKLGADDYITKPYNMGYLILSIKRTLEK